MDERNPLWEIALKYRNYWSNDYTEGDGRTFYYHAVSKYLCSLSSGVGSSTVMAFSAFLNGRYPPADLTGDITVSYNSPTGNHSHTRTHTSFMLIS